MTDGNANAEDAAKEYYPRYTKTDGTVVEAINTLGVDLNGDDTPSQEAKTCSVSFNGSDIETPAGFGSGKHNFNSKFSGTYNGLEFSSGLKMEGTTLVEFTTQSTATVIIVQSTWSDHTLKFDDQELSLSSATTPAGSSVRVYTLTAVPAGHHKISRGSGESGIFYVEVREEGATTAIRNMTGVVSTAYYDVNGRRLSSPRRGVNIRIDTFADGRRTTSKTVMR